MAHFVLERAAAFARRMIRASLSRDPTALQHPGEIKKHAGALAGTISRCVDEVLKQGPVDV